MPPPPPSSTASQIRADRAPDLPTGFIPISHILDEKAKVGSSVSVIGLAKDARAPIATRGDDHKTALILFDTSCQDSGYGLDVNIFGRPDELPHVNVGDVIIVISAKVQRYKSNPLSLISSFQTVIHVFSASKIPKPPTSAKTALLSSTRKSGPNGPPKEPTNKEYEFVSLLYHGIDKYDLPDEDQFTVSVQQSVNVREKFCLLQDVHEGRFSDLVGQIVQEPYDSGDKVTVYLSDYTENARFFNYTWEGVQHLKSGKRGQGYYANKEPAKKKDWIGPYGKRVLQITCYDSHANNIRSNVKIGTWVLLQNVQIKFGSNGTNLEGFLRGEQNVWQDRVRVHVLETDNPETVDPRAKEAIRRRREYAKAKKADIKKLKRKHEGLKEGLPNSKQRRRLIRSEAERKADEKDIKVEKSLRLNRLINSESADQPVRSVESIIEPVFQTMTLAGAPANLQLPFVCGKYRANVRVVDFRPDHLEEFVCSRTVTAEDCLSDNSDSSSSDSDSARDDYSQGVGNLIWEWRFMLQLEDAAAKDKTRNRVWVIVDNFDAQCLTGLDATDLRRDSENLEMLRERLFTLWGDLEEHKARKIAEQKAARKRRPGDIPPPMDSSDGEGDQTRGSGAKAKADEPAVSNNPFTCCIKQYGVRVREDDPALANAGEGRRWERVFGLFGTKICG